MSVQYRCKNEGRRQAVRDSKTVNGIDYLEVSQDQLKLEVHFFYPLPGQPHALTPGNVVIEGGVRVQNPPVKSVSVDESVSAEKKVLKVELTAYGDFSAYTLRLVKAPGAAVPPDGFDRQLSEVQFFFKVDCPSDFDCSEALTCPTPVAAVPPIDYLAKDYASFQRLLLDRLAFIMPDWQEHSPVDVGIMLVELLAYAGDYLSYFQDAVATEAYLGTARRRTSVRRHARLVDYHMHDGANARAWVVLQVNAGSAADGAKLPGPVLVCLAASSARNSIRLNVSHVEQTIGAFSGWSTSIETDVHRADCTRTTLRRYDRSGLGDLAKNSALSTGS